MTVTINNWQQADQYAREAKSILDKADSEQDGVLTTDQQKRLDHITSAHEAFRESGGRGRLKMPNQPQQRQSEPNPIGGPSASALASSGGGFSGTASGADRGDTAGFKSLTEFLASVAAAGYGQGYDQRLEATLPHASQGLDSGAGGGFTVPPGFMDDLIMSAQRTNPWLSRRRNITAPGNEVTVPALDDRDRTNDYAGLSMPRTTEGATLTESSVTFKARTLRLNKAAELIRVSNELLADSALSMDSVLTETFARAYSRRQALDTIQGDGVGGPQGVLNSNARYTVSRDTASDVKMVDLATMVSRLAPGASPFWLMHPSTIEKVYQLSDTVGNNIIFGNAREGGPQQLLGFEVFVTEAAPQLGNAGNVILLDLSNFLYLSRPLQVEASRDAAFDTDEVLFRAVARDAGMLQFDQQQTDASGWAQSEVVVLGS